MGIHSTYGNLPFKNFAVDSGFILSDIWGIKTRLTEGSTGNPKWQNSTSYSVRTFCDYEQDHLNFQGPFSESGLLLFIFLWIMFLKYTVNDFFVL